MSIILLIDLKLAEPLTNEISLGTDGDTVHHVHEHTMTFLSSKYFSHGLPDCQTDRNFLSRESSYFHFRARVSSSVLFLFKGFPGMVPLLYFNCSHPELLTPFPKWKTWEKARGVPDATAVPYWIIMKSKTPEKFEKLLPNDYWLPVPWRFYAWHPHHTSRDRSCFLRMILFINNTKNTFYETKVLKIKHVSFLKYIFNALLISYRTFGPVSLRNLQVAVRWTGANFDRCN